MTKRKLPLGGASAPSDAEPVVEPAKLPRLDDTASTGTSALCQLMETINGRWGDLAAMPTLSSAEGASIPPFGQTEFLIKMKGSRSYRCTCTLFATNVVDVLVPDVPVCYRQVDELQGMYFQDDSPPNLDFLPELCVEVPKKDLTLQKVWGTLRLVSPIELVLAMLTACVRDIQADMYLKEWRNCLRAVPMVFQLCETPRIPSCTA